VHLEVLVASPDGRDVVEVAGEGDAEDIGSRLATRALEAGADRILAAIRG
jgi:porphobilinogen deaminase